MNVLIVYAHPEPQSLNGSLKTFAIDRLTALGHDVRVSDLYAMHWKASADGADFTRRDPSTKLDQNGGDYDIPALTLKADLEDPEQHGFRLHQCRGAASTVR